MSVAVTEIDQAAFDAWLYSKEGRRVFQTCGHILFEERANTARQADFLVNALRVAFRRGFVAGRSNIRPNGGSRLKRRSDGELPY